MRARAWTVIAVLCLANFAVFFVMALILGGDAINGKVEDGRFFLASHGELTEVSRDTFLYSRYHAISLFVTQPLVFLAAWRAKVAKGATPRRP